MLQKRKICELETNSDLPECRLRDVIIADELNGPRYDVRCVFTSVCFIKITIVICQLLRGQRR